jgi:hypothetical protein
MIFKRDIFLAKRFHNPRVHPLHELEAIADF